MKTYWDFTEKERAKLTEEEITQLLDVELMTKGVKKIIAPKLKEIQEVVFSQETWFEVEGILFKDAETAQKFIALQPRKATYDYALGYDYQYAALIKQNIEQKQLYSHQDLLDLSVILKQNKQAKAENDEQRTEYDKNIEEQNKVLNFVWSDYWRCKNRYCELQKIVETKAEYLKMTNGDDELALSFLKKIYSEEDIKESLDILVI